MDEKLKITNFDDCTVQNLDTNRWMDTVKEAINKLIKKPIYQTKITPEIHLFKLACNTLRQNAEVNGWRRENYKDYISIRSELRG